MISAENNLAPEREILFDVVICGLGYESRSRFVAENFAPTALAKIAISFNHSLELAYSKNKQFYEGNKFDLVSCNYTEILLKLRSIQRQNPKVLKVLLDISSMSKEMMAFCIQALKACVFSDNANSNNVSEVIDLCTAYAPSSFQPATEVGPIAVQGPVSRQLSGWSARPDKPVAALIGLGNTKDMAIGAIQSIEPSLVWTFSAVGLDQRFDESVSEANKKIHEVFGSTNFKYRLDSTSELRRLLSGLIAEISVSHRVVIVPLGPKVLSYAAILTALMEPFSEASIWRFSAGAKAVPYDCKAQGKIIWHQAKVEL